MKIPGITLILFVQLRKIRRYRKVMLILMNLTTDENTTCYSLIAISIAYLQGMKRKKKREKNRKEKKKTPGPVWSHLC